jgi:DNA segregation ATPase FtsK/SpoIIIE, S-DNA-T family
MDFQISVADMRHIAAAHGVQSDIDCLVSADSWHTVKDLIAAIAEVCDSPLEAGQPLAEPDLWLEGARLEPSAALAGSGIHDGARLGLGGPASSASYRDHTAVAEIRVVSGPDAGLVVPVLPGEHAVARGGGDVRLTDTDVSRARGGREAHCVIAVTAAGGQLTYTVRDCGSVNGTGLDGVPVGTEPVAVRPGQLVGVGRDLLTLARPSADKAETAPGSDPFSLRLSRSPRQYPYRPQREVIEFQAEPAAQDKGTSWLSLLIAPAVSLAAGAAVGAILHQWLFLLLGVGGVVVSLTTQLSSRRTSRKRQRSAGAEFRESALAAQLKLADSLTIEQVRRRDDWPDPAYLAQIATTPGTRLWERKPSDADFLHLRVGLADLPAISAEVRGPAGRAGGSPAVARNVPATAALPRLGVLGVAGPVAPSRSALAWMVAQVVVLHSPQDVHLALLTDEPGAWTWARWLPHLRPLPGGAALANLGADDATWVRRISELADLVHKRRVDASNPRRPGGTASPTAVVLVLDGAHRLRQLPGMAAVLSDGPAVGVYAICRDDSLSRLPQDCRGSLVVGSGSEEVAVYRDPDMEIQMTRPDIVSAGWAQQVARALAPLRDVPDNHQAGIPGSVRLLDLWGLTSPTAEQIADGWLRRGSATKVPMGRNATGLFELDLARSGPHMLVAGTTGAGKSEFLRSLVVSLALGNPPDALNFILVDYKGGSAFAHCSKLPHVTGFLTDLDEHLTQRALTAIKAEVRYREQALADAHCKDIDDYLAAGARLRALPRLVLVVDEFRFLVDQVPDFLQQLTDVTARGRSLGVHLVLATQRPAGVVSEDIRTNMALRVCLRVEDPVDSTAVVEIPDAAAIDRQFSGRGYARTQRGSAQPFQGGYISGSPSGADAVATVLRVVACPFERLGETAVAGGGDRKDGAQSVTDLSLVVRAFRETGQQPPEHRPWVAPLPRLLPVAELPAVVEGTGLSPVGYGMEDKPQEQSQQLLAFDLEAGEHLLAIGPPQSGRTTLLRTIAAGIAASHSSRDVHLYVLDCGAGGLAPLAALPHCGAVVRRAEQERAGRLLDRLAAEMGHRDNLLAAGHFASIVEQRRAAAPGDRLPYMVLLLDRWEGFSADLGQIDGGRLTDLMNRLLSEGVGAGLRVIATGDRTAMNRLGRYFPDQRLVLQTADRNDLQMLGAPRGASMPDDPPPGRGLVLPGGSEIQVAFAGDSPDGAAQNAALEALIAAVDEAPMPAPLRVDAVPDRIGLRRTLTLSGGLAGRNPLRPVVAVGGDEMAALTIDLARYPGFAIAGPPGSGRSTALLVIAECLLAAGATVVGFTPRDSLSELEGRPGVARVFTAADVAPAVLEEILDSAEGPVVVLVDDAEALHAAPIGGLLAQIPDEGRRRGHALVVAGSAGEFTRTQRAFTAAARKYRCGLLLTPEAPQIGFELFGARLPRSAAFDRPPGRGYLIQGGQVILAQVPDPTLA